MSRRHDRPRGSRHQSASPGDGPGEAPGIGGGAIHRRGHRGGDGGEGVMESIKLQASNFREASNFNPQDRIQAWRLKFEVSLKFEAWSLKFLGGTVHTRSPNMWA